MIGIERRAFIAGLLALLAACGGADVGVGAGSSSEDVPTLSFGPPVNGPAWTTLGGNAQHTGVTQISTQDLDRIRWRAAVDMAPQYSPQGYLLVHYGPPVITTRNTVIIPVKTGAAGGFAVEAREGSSGMTVWRMTTDYVLPPHNWTPSYNVTRTAANRVYAPGAGGKLFYRDNADAASSPAQSVAFYGDAVYAANSTALDTQVFVHTPITADSAGNVYFGFLAAAGNAAGLTSGIARIASDGTGTWVAASAIALDAAMKKLAMNSAPALSGDEKTLYVVVNDIDAGAVGTGSGYIAALDAATLFTKSATRLLDPHTGARAHVSDDSTASPVVGPDGDVYIGVLESATDAHNGRGWMLHYDASLRVTKTPGSYGWDNTPAIVPASMVPGYAGTSTYLLMTLYNNEGRHGSGDSRNRLAILDPNASQGDFVAGIPVMKEVMTILGVTPDPSFPGGVVEWDTSIAAVDPFTRSVLVKSSDGSLYRWSLATNSLSQQVRLTSGLGQGYTPMAVGADGKVYAIDNAVLFAVGK